MVVWKYLQILCILMIGFLIGVFMTNNVVNIQLSPSFSGDLISRASPQNHITEDRIKVYNDRILLDLQDASWATFADTKSMEPILNKDSNGIEIKPESSEQIKVGDIIGISKKASIILLLVPSYTPISTVSK